MVKQSDVDVGQIENTATVNALDPQGNQQESDSVLVILATPTAVTLQSADFTNSSGMLILVLSAVLGLIALRLRRR